MIINRIKIDPNVCMRQPTVRGLRITVPLVLKMLANGMSPSEVVQAYPELEPEDIRQVVEYSRQPGGWQLTLDILHISSDDFMKDRDAPEIDMAKVEDWKLL